ncbi:hypothetical protein M408DRAFT_19179 [Serendipita vermifera MAFF 305830]|uniref:F-box domain-containing protein n=1 Tax=Serendipita vermifera MAFF 305830 TaxID=933852 RepID=A0A0C3BS78_SERVB|nr:hypothetical protein M408DRAFT_19179 [Serendipita vermifera MAFF 305830]
MLETNSVYSFLDLPPEISIQTLLNLEWNELLAVQRVNRAFKALIETSRIQYRIALGIAGYKDGPDSHPMAVSERLESLRTLQSCFVRLELPTKSRIEISGPTPIYELQGGVFVQGRHPPNAPNEMIGVNAWSFHDPTTPFGWQLPNFSSSIRDLTLDPSQDLLVLIEGGHRNKPLALRFLSLTTGGVHLSVRRDFNCPDYGPCDQGFIITICGDLVGLLSVDTSFFICNWKTGEVYVDIQILEEGAVDDFFFLDHERFVLVCRNSNPAKLQVYALRDDLGTSVQRYRIADYHLPLVHENVTISSIQARSDPPPRNDLPYTSSPRFTTPPYAVLMKERIFILTINMLNPEGHRNVILVMRAETLMNIPDAAKRAHGPAIVTSEMWMNQTRMLPNLIPANQWMCFCYGSRMVTCTEYITDTETRRVRHVKPSIIDFNPRLSAWVESGRTGTPWDPHLPLTMRKGSDAEFLREGGKKDTFWAEEWISGLPFIVETGPPDSNRYPLNHFESVVFMLDDRRLIVLKMARRGIFSAREARYMDIYTS